MSGHAADMIPDIETVISERKTRSGRPDILAGHRSNFLHKKELSLFFDDLGYPHVRTCTFVRTSPLAPLTLNGYVHPMTSHPSSGQVIALIPARYESTRFPGKPLANRTGKPLIQHVVERVRQASSVDRIIVATDDQRIFEAVQSFGGHVMMTGEHLNGTSRLAEVVASLGDAVTDDDVILNVQGDEPEVEPTVINQLADVLRHDPDAPMATLASSFAPHEDASNPNIVKVVTTAPDDAGRCRALYFSRSLIPFDRDGRGDVTPMKHPGLYAYRRSFLLQYVKLSATPLEQTECLEQLRALEHGYPIAIVRTQVKHHGIDTPEQYEAFVQRMETERT